MGPPRDCAPPYAGDSEDVAGGGWSHESFREEHVEPRRTPHEVVSVANRPQFAILASLVHRITPW